MFAHRDMRSLNEAILAAAKRAPLQTLTDRELKVRDQPVTLYPPTTACAHGFGSAEEAVPVDAKGMRSTPLAAGIEFCAGDQTFWCWA